MNLQLSVGGCLSKTLAQGRAQLNPLNLIPVC